LQVIEHKYSLPSFRPSQDSEMVEYGELAGAMVFDISRTGQNLYLALLKAENGVMTANSPSGNRESINSSFHGIYLRENPNDHDGLKIYMAELNAVLDELDADGSSRETCRDEKGPGTPSTPNPCRIFPVKR
jgi:hypothetical protein